MEKIVARKITAFLNTHCKLLQTQHGFRKNRSCQSQLLEAVHDWAKALDDGVDTHAVFLDFSRAFDTVPLRCLLLKLDAIGIRGSLLDWIEAFLSNREQRVILNGSHSQWEPVSSGVPQGSILGPLLFLVYVNDISDDITSPMRLFADDCAIY